METDPRKTVKEIVLAMPASTMVFERLGIDYCCGGDKPLEEACRAAGQPVEDVLRSLEAAKAATQAGGPGVTDWSRESLASLMNYIVERHHTYCRQGVAGLESLLMKVSEKHGRNHPELSRLKSLFSGMSKELLMHLVKEEQTLFPYITRMEESVTRGMPFPKPPFGTVQNPVQMMVLEYDNAGAVLHEMRQLCGDYRVPPDACSSYQALYEELKSFENDMHQHIHLENNLLFPRSIEMENVAIAPEGRTGN
ncbi:MAG TPA: iron-sulfur cluster repair di-iron protein [Terriglobia bacterium]|nr:iron-sulfur cluster repair di-iron protein [Terriglobia bacterium]